MSTLIPIEQVEQKILLIRGQKVMLDSELGKEMGTFFIFEDSEIKNVPIFFFGRISARKDLNLRVFWGLIVTDHIGKSIRKRRKMDELQIGIACVLMHRIVVN